MRTQKRISVFLVAGDDWLPLSTGLLQAYAQFGPHPLNKTFEFIQVPKFFFPFAKSLAVSTSPGIWLFSNYLWNVEDHLALSKAVKEINKENITIHGGPSVPKYEGHCQRFLEEHQHIDIAARGEGEFMVAQLLKHFASKWNGTSKSWKADLEHIAGISFAFDESRKSIVRTEDSARVTDLDQLPSPYLEGVFDDYSAISGILETNRGCPYRCTFCDWGSLTQQKIKQFDLERVKKEIDWMGKKQLSTVFIADANFGIFERDIAIAEQFVHTKEKYDFPKEIIVSYAKNSTLRLAEITKIWTKSGLTTQGIISIQTSDEQTLDIIKRKNIKTSKYDELAVEFRKLGLPLSSDLMIGLPGSTIESFKRDLQRYFDDDISVRAYPTKLLPNSPMAHPDYIEKYKIETDENDMLVSTFSYTEEEYEKMLLIYQYYHVLEDYSFLRYVLRFIQWDHGINALDFIERLVDHPMEAPILRTIVDAMEDRPYLLKLSEKYIGQFFMEVEVFARAQFALKFDNAFKAVVEVNNGVIPSIIQTYPLVLELPYDVLQYVKDHIQNKKEGFNKPLKSYAPSNLIIEDPEGLAIEADNHQVNFSTIYWELYSPLRRAKATPFLMDW